MKCYRCKQEMSTADLIGINIFDALSGMHITTRRYCKFCASTIGLITK